MKVSIVVNGKVLRSIQHKKETYIEAPAKGDYAIRLHNYHHKRRMAVVSVDGVNILNATDAGYDGPGYVLDAWQTVDVPGWHRDNGKVADFEFDTKNESYANKTGRGTNNVGVIGVAFFDEKVIEKPTEHHHHHYPWYRPFPWVQPWVAPAQPYDPWAIQPYITCGADYLNGLTTTSSTLCVYSAGMSPNAGNTSLQDAILSAQAQEKAPGGSAMDCQIEPIPDVGTAYGKETAFFTQDVEFSRKSKAPVSVIKLRYATREKLVSWGVPVDEKVSDTMPNPFPMSESSCPAPAGWKG